METINTLNINTKEAFISINLDKDLTTEQKVIISLWGDMQYVADMLQDAEELDSSLIEHLIKKLRS